MHSVSTQIRGIRIMSANQFSHFTSGDLRSPAQSAGALSVAPAKGVTAVPQTVVYSTSPKGPKYFMIGYFGVSILGIVIIGLWVDTLWLGTWTLIGFNQRRGGSGKLPAPWPGGR